jgi:hypothetical protein
MTHPLYTYVSDNVAVVKPEGRRPLERPRRRWEDNHNINTGGVDWIELAQERDRRRALVYTVMHLRVP